MRRIIRLGLVLYTFAVVVGGLVVLCHKSPTEVVYTNIQAQQAGYRR